MGLKLLKTNFFTEIDWESKNELLITLQKISKGGERDKISKIMNRLSFIGVVGVDIQHKPSQFAFYSKQNIFKLKQLQDAEPQEIKGRITILDNLAVQEEIPHKAEFYVYKDDLYCFEAYDIHNQEEKKLLIKEQYFNRNRKLDKLQKEIHFHECLETGEIISREPIPEDVRFAVWRRDGGQCVKCGSKGKLEFDHIIPVSKGGSNTERNVQLLCEKCNREKSDKI